MLEQAKEVRSHSHLNKIMCAKAPLDCIRRLHSSPPCGKGTHLPLPNASKSSTP